MTVAVSGRTVMDLGARATVLDAMDRIRAAGPDILSPERFAPGTMRPKIEAACCFAARTGGAAAIGALVDAQRLLDGTSGTTIAAGAGRMMLYSAPADPGRACA